MTHALYPPRTAAVRGCILFLYFLAWLLIGFITAVTAYGAAALLRWAFG